MKPNTDFTLSVRDLEIIETALEAKISRRAIRLIEQPDAKLEAELAEMRELLARLHHQKTWYRPKNKTYIGG
jgi:hypothetical protein